MGREYSEVFVITANIYTCPKCLPAAFSFLLSSSRSPLRPESHGNVHLQVKFGIAVDSFASTCI